MLRRHISKGQNVRKQTSRTNVSANNSDFSFKFYYKVGPLEIEACVHCPYVEQIVKRLIHNLSLCLESIIIPLYCNSSEDAGPGYPGPVLYWTCICSNVETIFPELVMSTEYLSFENQSVLLFCFK